MSVPVVIALHYQNDVLHEAGRIKVGLGDDDVVRANLISGAKRILLGARERGWPIFHVRVAYRPDYADLGQNAPILRGVAKLGAVVDGSWGADFLEDLKPLSSENEFVVTHKRINAFYGTILENLINNFNTKQLIIAGVATHSVVESTVRHAVDCGFEVTVAADACASADNEVHVASLKSMSLIAKISNVSEVMEELS